MGKTRLEAFSDGVIAIIITIMVLEMRAPHEPDLDSLRPVLPVFGSYVLSFVYVAIYWNNHHHLLHTARHVTGGILWANLHLLFWLSLVPFVTAWMGENHFEQQPVALYGVVMLMAGIAYYILELSLMRYHGPESALRAAVGNDVKGMISVVMYALAIAASFGNRWIAVAIYVAVALMWLIPDPRIEKRAHS
jgi:TMEM175 potassium channel family protein